MKDLPLHVQLAPQSGKRLYEQIYAFIKGEIRDGRLLCGEKLPSARLLAEDLQVSRTTVDMAYGQLVAEGYLEARPKQGYFVADCEGLCEVPAPVAARVETPVSDTETSASESFIDFSPDAIDMSLFPYATWKKISRSVLVDQRSDLFALGDPQGDAELRFTICRYLHASRGVDCQPEQIIIGAGNDYLLLLLARILGKTCTVAMETPMYPRACKLFASFGFPIRFVPMDADGMDVSALKKSGASLAYVMPARQYPTGVLMPIRRRLELLRWAAEKPERYLIEDDYDSEFRYKGKPIPALYASDAQGKVVYIGTFSKAIAPAIRISYMVLPMALLAQYKERCGFYTSTVSRIDQAILNAFIKDGYFERYLNKMRKYYRQKQEMLLAALSDWGKDFSVSGEEAGLHLLLSDKRGRSEKKLWQQAMDAGVRTYPLSDFLPAEKKSAADKRPGTLLLGFGGLAPHQMQEGMERLRMAWT